MVCMLTHSRHSVIHFGGIGVMVHTAGAGAVEAVGLVRLIQTVVRMDKAVTEILLLYVDMVQAPLVLVVLLFGQLVARLVPPDQLMAGEQAQQDAW